MSIVADQIRRLDIQLDKIQLAGIISAPPLPVLVSSTEANHDVASQHQASPRRAQLKSIVRSLSTSSSSKSLLEARSLIHILGQVQFLQKQDAGNIETSRGQEDDVDLEWLVVGKATLQIYGLVLSALLEQIIPLSDDIWYWDEVLNSYAYTGIYTLQTSPLRAWKQVQDVYQDVKSQFRSDPDSVQTSARPPQAIGGRWREFYDLVQKSIRDRSTAQAKARILSPFALCRTEARQKQTGLKKLREMNATGLGVLMDEGLSFDIDIGYEGSPEAKGRNNSGSEEWRRMVPKSIALMETVLRNVTTLDVGTAEFEEIVFTTVEEASETGQHHHSDTARPAILVETLQRILKEHLPLQLHSSMQLSVEYGRPSSLTRYWIPASLLLFSSSTLLRIITNRRAEILTWVQELGSTVIDFWMNWVIEPAKKLIGTIRHDENSEVAIMSKRSLEADRDSLERMVVDFAVDNPPDGSRSPPSEAEIANLRAAVKEGDLTPVLKVYERDLRRPFVGSIRGDLVRSLLIQIQKTKVDVEIAIGGIDALLKSQELVFGFIGLTPGILATFAVFRWLGGVFGNRKGLRQSQHQGAMIRTLRNIDRILNASHPTPNGMLSYKEHGLLLCEVHVLRQRAGRVLPGEINREFLEEVGDLVDIRTGVLRQQKVVERMRWAYARWL